MSYSRLVVDEDELKLVRKIDVLIFKTVAQHFLSKTPRF